LTLKGPVDGSGNLTISGDHVSRVLNHQGSGTLTLTKLTIADGSVSQTGHDGGGCVKSASNVSLTGSTVTGCFAQGLFGGGIYAKGNTILLASVVSNNELTASNARGAGIASDGFTSKYSSITGNRATRTSAYGGGAAIGTAGALVEATTIAYNEAYGGSAFVTKSDSTIANSTISNNTGQGGAVYFIGPLSAKISNTTIAFNHAAGDIATGGIALTLPIDAQIDLEIESSIVAMNTKRFNSPSDLLCYGPNRTFSGTRNLMLQVDGDCPIPMDFAVALDPKLRPLALNGGLTKTHALLPGSPAIGNGSNVLTPPLTTDQRGQGYPRSTTSVSGTTTDIGAYEYDSIFANPFD